MPRSIILSPHLDDAVFDCWHLLAQADATVLNVFGAIPPEGTRTFWDRVCGDADSPRMMQQRIAENDIAVAMSGIKTAQLYLDYMDTQYRSSHPTPAELADAIERKAPQGTYYAPLAISLVFRHKDHVLLRLTALELHKRGHDVAFYPDAPYMNPPHTPRPATLKRLHARAEKILGLPLRMERHDLSAKQLQTKDSAMHAYVSQYKMTNLESFGGLKRTGRRPYELVFRPGTPAD